MSAHGAVVLAAGASKRLGRAKQLVEIDGEPLLRRVARAVLATRPRDAVAVLGHDADRIAAALEGLAIRQLRIDDADEGMSASLRAGVAALGSDCTGALVVLTDQLALGAAHLEALCAAWRAAPARAVASTYADVLGVPALLPRAWFADVAALRGDTGARALLRARRHEVVAIAAPELARDIDTPDDVTRA
ncbi:MAG TPA: nucleotidyltransferase family protein [Rhodanobacteraceae bacterium]|nr:nucleotidyltransferase family protein [Rhodanobacteraceae bacterium]